MPTLPTFTVTDAQAQRMLAAWGSVENYKNWLREQIALYVSMQESTADRLNKRDEIASQLMP